MTFYVQGLSGHERMVPGDIFKESVVEKTEKIMPLQAIDVTSQ